MKFALGARLEAPILVPTYDTKGNPIVDANGIAVSERALAPQRVIGEPHLQQSATINRATGQPFTNEGADVLVKHPVTGRMYTLWQNFRFAFPRTGPAVVGLDADANGQILTVDALQDFLKEQVYADLEARAAARTAIVPI